jgi:maltooligosyltrehalose trehalohydrolase
VWAPAASRVEVVIEDDALVERTIPMDAEAAGYFSCHVEGIGAGTLYRLRPEGSGPFPDPASRFQPRGVHGPSCVVDPAAYRWRDDHWRGVQREGHVMYEMHVGTFAAAGTWAAAADELPALADTGITVIEMMPVADFAGDFGWGYDGVDLFAPTRLYGEPDDLRSFIDRAHAAGIGVILDVVYNHLGPVGNYLPHFSKTYFTTRYWNEWGEAVNFDGPGAEGVREFVLANVRYWIDEFHFDGLRLDATQSIKDSSACHIIACIADVVREAAQGRDTLVVAESEPQDANLARPKARGGYGLDALWNDDFHHSAMVAATARNEAYYSDYLGSPQELVSALRHGFLYQGQRYSWQKKRRGSPAWDLGRNAFVHFLQNHDQVANSAAGARLHFATSPGRFRALTALLLLGPPTPLLFQGQEFAASAPFLYFADHEGELAEAVKKGRRKFLSQFPSLAQADTQSSMADPANPTTFERCKLDLSERKRHGAAFALHRDLLRLRREQAVFRSPRSARFEGAVLTPLAFVLRWFGSDDDDRLVIINLGRQLHLVPAPEPLLAPPRGHVWDVLWSSEDACYGGAGTPDVETEGGWNLPGESALVLQPGKPDRHGE